MCHKFGETVYISEVNGARKVKSVALVAINKNSDPVLILLSLGVIEKDSAPSHIFHTSGIVQNESS